jgi:3-(3-hydroxy-phenyl)propionate hydroxylase
LLAAAAHAANGTLFPQPWVRTKRGRQLLDAASGTGWRLVVDGGSSLAASTTLDDQARAPGLRIIRIGAAEGMVEEEDGVVARWFGRYECAAAIVRPDHYVFGVTTDAPSTAAMLSELSARLQ